VPAATPKAIIDKTAADLSRLLPTPEFRYSYKYILAVGLEPLSLQVAELVKETRESTRRSAPPRLVDAVYYIMPIGHHGGWFYNPLPQGIAMLPCECLKRL
jgi:hypothetical protein